METVMHITKNCIFRELQHLVATKLYDSSIRFSVTQETADFMFCTE